MGDLFGVEDRKAKAYRLRFDKQSVTLARFTQSTRKKSGASQSVELYRPSLGFNLTTANNRTVRKPFEVAPLTRFFSLRCCVGRKNGRTAEVKLFKGTTENQLLMSTSTSITGTGFDRFALHETLVRGIRVAGFENPRPIQLETIPASLDGRDANLRRWDGKFARISFIAFNRSAATFGATTFRNRLE